MMATKHVMIERETSMNLNSWLTLDEVLELEPVAARLRVSKVARSKYGFVRVYESVDGKKEDLKFEFYQRKKVGRREETILLKGTWPKFKKKGNLFGIKMGTLPEDI